MQTYDPQTLYLISLLNHTPSFDAVYIVDDAIDGDGGAGADEGREQGSGCYLQ
jgi:hypothetical protein